MRTVWLVTQVMELCDRGTLLDMIRKSLFQPAPPKWNETIALRALLRSAAEVAKALVFVHGLDIVHGDLKPGNVLLKSAHTDRRGFSCKLTDFGLSHVLDGNQTQSTETFGTLAYMSPEHVQGKIAKHCDGKRLCMCGMYRIVTGGSAAQGGGLTAGQRGPGVLSTYHTCKSY